MAWGSNAIRKQNHVYICTYVLHTATSSTPYSVLYPKKPPRILLLSFLPRRKHVRHACQLTKQVNDGAPVASAIVRLATMRAPHASLAMADCTTPGATAARVGRLLAPEDPLPPRRLGAAVATLVGVLSLPVAVALTPAAVAGISHLCTGIT